MKDLLPPFITEKQIATRVDELAGAVTRDVRKLAAREPIVCICVLRGAHVFFADLIRKLDLPLTVDFLRISSYGQSTTSSGHAKILHDLDGPIDGRHVLLVEDIVDTGLTVSELLSKLEERGAASIRLCSLLLKPANLKKKIPIDYLGFTVQNQFIVGYGLDGGELYRNLPYLAVLPESERKKLEKT